MQKTEYFNIWYFEYISFLILDFKLQMKDVKKQFGHVSPHFRSVFGCVLHK